MLKPYEIAIQVTKALDEKNADRRQYRGLSSGSQRWLEQSVL